MRAYARDMAMLGDARRQMEAFLLRDQPNLKPSERRRIAKHYVMKAYKDLKREIPEQRADGVLSGEERREAENSL